MFFANRHTIFKKPTHISNITLIILFKNSYISFILLNLIGRRHQLRLHCHSLGHNIIGDYTYSDGQDSEPSRMYLHSHRYLNNCDIQCIVLLVYVNGITMYIRVYDNVAIVLLFTFCAI